MSWRSAIVGGLITLIVTVVAGVIVYLITREPKVSERLSYSVQTSATFGTDPSRLTFWTVKVRNDGGKAAHGVSVAADLDQSSKIQERRINLSSGPATAYVDTSTSRSLRVSIPNLVPSDSAEISLLIRGRDVPGLRVAVHSPESIGNEVPFVGEPVGPVSKWLTRFAAIFPILFAAVAGGYVFTQLIFATKASPNNAAFLYLNKGLIAEAKSILDSTIISRGVDAVALANIALAAGLSGDNDGAWKRFAAADWWAKIPHEKGVIEFDKAVLLFSQGEFALGIPHLRRAFALSRFSVPRYCRLSVYILEAMKANPDVRRLVETRGREPTVKATE